MNLTQRNIMMSTLDEIPKAIVMDDCDEYNNIASRTSSSSSSKIDTSSTKMLYDMSIADSVLTTPLLPTRTTHDEDGVDRTKDEFSSKLSSTKREPSPIRCHNDEDNVAPTTTTATTTEPGQKDSSVINDHDTDTDVDDDDMDVDDDDDDDIAEEDCDGGFPEMNFAGGLMGEVSSELDRKVETLLRRGSMVAIGMWILFLVAIFTLSPPESYERLEGVERNVSIIILFLLLYTNVSKLLRIIVRDKSFLFVNTGIMMGSVTVQAIAMLSIAMMTFLPTPIVIDPVTGIRSHLVRWAEWTSLAFLMTFLTESIDLPLTGRPTIAWAHGIAIGLSTSCGGLSAFCRTWTEWLAVITVSWILFCSLFIRLYQRYRRLAFMPPGVTADEKEDYDRAKYSLKTIKVCAVAWTFLAVCWNAVALMAPGASPGSIFARKDLVLVTESFFEALSKIWYADLLVEIHNIVFDDASRTVRRLEELRAFMSAVWDHSSDILIWGSRRDNVINGIVSPSFFAAENAFGVVEDGSFSSHGTKSGKVQYSTVLLEVHPTTGEYRSLTVNLKHITRDDAVAVLSHAAQKKCQRIDVDAQNGGEKNLSVIADLLCHAYKMDDKRETTAIRELYSSASVDNVCHCEAKSTKLDSASCLIVLRDISERYQLFETEKRLIEERTARRKDSEANRFTRHEVKNGILAAIGLVESMRDSKSTTSSSSRLESNEMAVPGSQQSTDNAVTDDRNLHPVYSNRLLDESPVLNSQDNSKWPPDRRLSFGSTEDTASSFGDCYGELDSTLRDVLDTIMDHAMSLDVINEEYDIRKERVSVLEVFSNIRRQATGRSPHARFTTTTSPDPFPILGLDPRLLRHVYQNALSNACRYGKYDGNVQTLIEYDDAKKEFKLSVFNEPGMGHDMLLAIPPEEVNRVVFSKGVRLHGSSFSDDSSGPVISASSGDGGWICKKIATIVDGKVDLKFQEDRTIFTFSCPAKKFPSVKGNLEDHRPLMTHLPGNTWGVVIDDSGIQRKLMARFLKIAGIEKDRRIVIGQNSEEIFSLANTVIGILKNNPGDKVLLIADENLEVADGGAVHGTVSGSLCIKGIIESLEPSEESRLLALVRSANDSSKDLALYDSRSHGCLPKAPIDSSGVMGILGPIWAKRFNAEGFRPPMQRSNSDNSTFASDGYDPYHDIMQVLEVISALCKTGNLRSLKNRWKSIQEKLQVLKGDLKSTIAAGESLEVALSAIDSLRLGSFPKDLRQQWSMLHDQIHDVMNSSR